MKRLAVVVSAGLALAVLVAAAQALEAPAREPVTSIELPAVLTHIGDAAERSPSTGKATPVRKIPIRTAAIRRPARATRPSPSAHNHRTKPRTLTRGQSSPARLIGGGDDDEDYDDDDDD
jgi:hypothetical protein